MKISTQTAAFTVHSNSQNGKVPGSNLRLPFQQVNLILRFMQQILYLYHSTPPTAPPINAVFSQFTAEAYTTRTGRPCSALSFQDIASGSFPEFLFASHPAQPGPARELNAFAQGSGEVDGREEVGANPASFPTVDMVICSFALHLLEELSERWALSELSWKATWLVVLEPHKKPEVSPSPALLPSILFRGQLQTLRSKRAGDGPSGTSMTGRVVWEHKGRGSRSLKTGMYCCFSYNCYL